MLADGEPGEQVEHRGGGQCDKHIGPGQLDVNRVREDRDGRGQAHPSAQHLAELIRTGPDEPDVVPPGQPESTEPENWQQEAQGKIRPGDIATEADLGGHEHAERGTTKISDCRPEQVVPGPAGQTPDRLTLVTLTSNGKTRHTHPPPAGSAQYVRALAHAPTQVRPEICPTYETHR